jgi:glycine hydroxymethyltransferase
MISKYFESLPYRLDAQTGTIDYDGLERLATLYHPKIIIAGTSAHSRLIDYARMRRITEKVGCYLLSDMSHIIGLVAAGVVPSPFPYSDVVTTSMSKTLRGPRGGMIFFRRGVKGINTKTNKKECYALEGPINASVFPGHQSSPHNNTTAALAVALQQAKGQEFKKYQQDVLRNAKALAEHLGMLGYKLVSGGTDNHLILIDLKPHGIDSARVEYVLELIGVASNRNMLPGDTSAREPSGLRIGSPAMTSRGFQPQDFARIAKIVDNAVAITIALSRMAIEHAEALGEKSPESLKLFMRFLKERKNNAEIAGLRKEIERWIGTFTKGGDRS